MEPQDRIIAALDVDIPGRTRQLVKDLFQYVGMFQIGSKFIHSILYRVVTPITLQEAVTNLQEIRRLFHELGDRILWDGKLCDIPSVVGSAARLISETKVQMFTVHASAGTDAMKAAVANKGAAKVLAVTVLSSLAEDECRKIFWGSAGEKIIQFATDAADAGCDGVICSSRELKLLGKQPGLASLFKVATDVYPEWAATCGREWLMTPAEAIRTGANYLVIGKSITQPPAEIGTPVEAAKLIAAEIASAI